MTFSSSMFKWLDPGGYLVEKTTPAAFAPYSGLHGTMAALNPKTPSIEAPKSPAAPAGPNSEAVESARRAQLQQSQNQKGRRATIVTGGEGVSPGNIGRRAALGA